MIDECHRAAAASYQSIIEHVRGLNPRVKLLGLSATPGRGDGRSLRKTFTNVGYQLKIGTLIARGLLVPPRTFTIDLGVERRARRARTAPRATSTCARPTRC